MVQPESNKGFKLVLETALLAAPAPLTVSELRRLFEDDPGSDEVRRVLGELVEDWQGRGVDEIGRDARTGQILVRIDPRYFRPAEVDCLLGDSTKARTVLGWEPQVRFPELIKTMVEADLQDAQRDQLCQTHGFDVHCPEE